VGGVTSNTASLSNTYQLNKTFIVADSQISSSSSSTPNQVMGRVYFSSISDGYSSELTAERGSTTNTMVSTYSIMQSDNIDVCHISHTMPNADGDEDVSLSNCEITIPSDFKNKCFVSTKNNVEASTTTSSCQEEQRVMANITSTSNLNLQRSSVACGASTVEAQIVCFNDDTTVTPVEIGPSTFATSTIGHIGHSVNLSTSWMIYSCQSDGNGIEQANIECYFNNESSLECRTTSQSTSESSNQQCVNYVIEFNESKGYKTQEHIPTDAEVGDKTIFTSILSSPVSDLSKTLGFCVTSFRNGEGSAYARGAYPCYMDNESAFVCERGQTGNSDPSNDFHCPIVEWIDIPPEVNTISNTENTGTLGINAFLLMIIEENSTGSWEYLDTVLNDTATNNQRSLGSGSILNLSDIWNGVGEGNGWDTSGGVPTGYHRARVSWVGSSGNILKDGNGQNISGTYEFFVDTVPPEVNLTYPENNSISYGLNAVVKYTATDPAGVVNCSLFHNKSTLFTLEQTKDFVEGVENNFTIEGFTENTYIEWNVRCEDGVGNKGFTSGNKYFTQIVPPDFLVNDTDIDLDNSSGLVEGKNYTLSATVWNFGGQDGIAEVEFWNGNPDFGGTYIGNTSVNILVNDFDIAEVNWSVRIGPNNIFVLVDPPIATNGTIEEINESNNIANKTFHVPSWQDFYGNSTIEILLGDNNSLDIESWGNTSPLDGNIFIVDEESDVEWSNLYAIGKDTTGGDSSNDFAEIDSELDMEEYADSVSIVFSNSQIPKATDSFIIHGRTVDFVPIINSTNTTNFVTGLLWDGSDTVGDNEYDSADQEDIIFVNKFNEQKNGFYGTYDYEITIPVKLRAYDFADETNVYLYYDLN